MVFQLYSHKFNNNCIFFLNVALILIVMSYNFHQIHHVWQFFVLFHSDASLTCVSHSLFLVLSPRFRS